MLLSSKIRAMQILKNGDQRVTEYEDKDLEEFLQASTESDYELLLARYSDDYYPFFGHLDSEEATPDWEYDAWYENTTLRENKPLIATAQYRETAADIECFCRLLEVAEKLAYLMRTANLKPETIRNHHLIINESSSGFDLEISIPLLTGLSSRHYLAQGIERAKQFGFLPYGQDAHWYRVNDSLGVLKIRTSQYAQERNNWARACEELFNSLNQIMLGDLRLVIDKGNLHLASDSVASTIWSLLLARYEEGRPALCLTCYKPFIAKNERRKRLYCGSACNKMHQRLVKYKKYVESGMSEKESANIAGVDLGRAVDYWSTNQF